MGVAYSVNYCLCSLILDLSKSTPHQPMKFRDSVNRLSMYSRCTHLLPGEL